MLLWFPVFLVPALSAWGDSSWAESEAKHRSEEIQDLFGNLSELREKLKQLLNDISNMVSRKNWAEEALNCSSPLARPVHFLVTHHIPGLECDNQASCSQRLRELQVYHVHNNSWCGVAYNFLVGNDGRVYEGVGWNVQGAHTQGYNNISLGFAFFGTKEAPEDFLPMGGIPVQIGSLFSSMTINGVTCGLWDFVHRHSPSPAALSAMEGLISRSILKGHLSPLFHQPLLVKGENCLAPKQEMSPKKVCPNIITRSAWGARETDCPKLMLPAKYAIIIQTAGRTCNMSDECRLLAQDIQSLLMDKYGTCDTSYNFLVGQDGAIYEGVGWNIQGFHTDGYNDISLGIAFMGTFSGAAPNAAALEAAQTLIQCAVLKGYLIPSYLLVGQSDLINTLSPGQALYNIIKSWPHFKH